ncbi:DUF2169 domain-containing protein [Acidovorax sp. SUPP3334]|uniref:DUF2169 family type VI secretion system accessory protein n=1 Tax=Acidovorax sp. SUPP3334 TaxID=2920881 RepID=UPI0023DE42A6|nr:DUF2169 domain-containing protein [Acidovorax sp. SUPP3334]GKT22972.1 DUF2169 domain-containing protein [Acidovorax sp. SUPP3334]
MSLLHKENAPAVHDSAIVTKHFEDAAQGTAGRTIPDVPLAVHINHTPFPSQYFQSVDQHGEVFHVVVLRVTYDMHRTLPDGCLAYAAPQTPLEAQDVWSGAVNESSPLWESDFAPYKPKCDVLVVNAVSRPPPEHLDAERWPCGIALQWVGDDGEKQTWSKSLTVTGPRQFGLISLSAPAHTDEVAIDWCNGFGGQIKRPHTAEIRPDGSVKKAAGSVRWDVDERNPVGVGFNKAMGQPGPQLELMQQHYTAGFGQDDYPPVGLSALGKAWLPRRLLAGTYDEAWLKEQWPLPPLDFDDAYWNCAPQDQQVDYLAPSTQLTLVNLYPPRDVSDAGNSWVQSWGGRLPSHQLSLRLALRIGGERLVHDSDMALDTLVVDLASQKIYATFRHAIANSALQEQKIEGLETWVSPAGRPYDAVPPDELSSLEI